MFIKTRRKIDTFPIVIRAYRNAEERLSGTCFRPAGSPLSGNFAQAKNLWQLLGLENGRVQEHLVRAAEEEFSEGGLGTCSVQIELADHVGWASTAPIAGFGEGESESELEAFSPNRHSSARRVIAGSARRAPKTKTLTVVYELREERHQLAVVIHSAYPGPDVGKLDGDVSAREGVAFFDWNHPGEE